MRSFGEAGKPLSDFRLALERIDNQARNQTASEINTSTMTAWAAWISLLALTAVPNTSTAPAAPSRAPQAAASAVRSPQAAVPTRPFYFPPAGRPQPVQPAGPIGRAAQPGVGATPVLPRGGAGASAGTEKSAGAAANAEQPPGGAQRTPTLPPIVATKQHFFAIPFRISPPENPNQAPREVQLYVSGDRGATWQLYTRAEPTQRQFLFRAASDGEYWFAVRTVDRQGHGRPAKITAPGMRVAIDTAPPRLELSAQSEPDGSVALHWTLEEPLPKLESLKLSYRVGDQGLWQAIPLEMDDVQRRGSIAQGKLQWQPYAPGEVQIRAETIDAAGNFAVGHAIVAVAPGQREKTSPTTTSPEPAPHSNVAQDHWRSKAEAAPSSGDRAPAAASGAITAPVEPNASGGPSAPPAATAPADAPADEAAIRWVATRQIELEYDINPLAGAVERVEIWGTADRGQSWHLLAVDEDRQSPVLAVVDADGLWGFRMIVRQAGIAASPAPKPGDPPDLSVGVRTAK